MTEKRTDEEKIDERLLVKRIWQRAYMDTEESHVQLIREYAAQELDAYKARLKKELAEFPEILYERPDILELIDQL